MNVCETIADKLHMRASAQSSKRYLIVRKWVQSQSAWDRLGVETGTDVSDVAGVNTDDLDDSAGTEGRNERG